MINQTFSDGYNAGWRDATKDSADEIKRLRKLVVWLQEQIEELQKAKELT